MKKKAGAGKGRPAFFMAGPRVGPILALTMVALLWTGCASLPRGESREYLDFIEQSWDGGLPKIALKADLKQDPGLWSLLLRSLTPESGLLSSAGLDTGPVADSLTQVMTDPGLRQRIHEVFLISGIRLNEATGFPEQGFQMVILGDIPRVWVGAYLASQGWEEGPAGLDGYPWARTFYSPSSAPQTSGSDESRGSAGTLGPSQGIRIRILETGVLAVDPVWETESRGGTRESRGSTVLARNAGPVGGITGFLDTQDDVSFRLGMQISNPASGQGSSRLVEEWAVFSLRSAWGDSTVQVLPRGSGATTDGSDGPSDDGAAPWFLDIWVQPRFEWSAKESPLDESSGQESGQAVIDAWQRSRSASLRLLLSSLTRRGLLPLTSQQLRNRVLFETRGVQGVFALGVPAGPDNLMHLVKELSHDWRN